MSSVSHYIDIINNVKIPSGQKTYRRYHSAKRGILLMEFTMQQLQDKFAELYGTEGEPKA